MSKLVIRNGQVIDPAQGLDCICDLAIEDGVIREIAANIGATGNEQLDATGLIVAPGFIDMHVHLREPGFEYAETLETGTQAAAAGGFTSVCCMPNTNPVNDCVEVTQYIVERARKLAAVNVYPIGAITEGSQGKRLADMAGMKQAGIVAISDDGKPVMNAAMAREAMEQARALQLPLIEHCEDLDLSDAGVMHEGTQSASLGLRGIPRSSEDVMVARDILLAQVTGARYHVAHVSSKYSVEMVAIAKRRGLPVSCEATPHHFVLADSDVSGQDCNYKMKPPLRDRSDIDAVVNGLVDGTIEAIATDHAPHPSSEKFQIFERCPFGILGLETALGLALDQLYHPGKLGLPELVRLFTTGPAGILSLDRGTLRPGSVADVTVFGLDYEWVYDVDSSPSKSRNSPFDGRKFRGGPVYTVHAGRVIWRQARFR